MHTAHVSPIRYWTTRDVEPRHRLDYWAHALCDGIVEMSARGADATAFHGELQSTTMGPLTLHRAFSSDLTVERTARAIERAQEHPFYLMGTRRGRWSVRHGGRQADLGPGELILVDSSHRYRFDFLTEKELISLQLPNPWLRLWLAQPERHVVESMDPFHDTGRRGRPHIGDKR